MLLAQINRDSQGMAEFQDADGQQVTLCLAEAVTVAGELPWGPNPTREVKRSNQLLMGSGQRIELDVCITGQSKILQQAWYFVNIPRLG